MIGLATLLVVLTLGLLITRVATVALRATGLSHEVARFQARSAFSGVGFSTSESEAVVNHPVRRRIVLWLMLLANAGLVTTVATLLLSFTDTSYRQQLLRLALLIAGLGLLWLLAHSSWVDRRLSRLIERALARWTDLDVRDYVSLLRVAGDYSIAEIRVEAGDWLEGRSLQQLELPDEGIVVLGVHRAGGHYFGAPGGSTPVEPGDTVVVYGRAPALAELEQRHSGAAGDRAHERACAEERRLREKEANVDERDVDTARHGGRWPVRRSRATG